MVVVVVEVVVVVVTVVVVVRIVVVVVVTVVNFRKFWILEILAFFSAGLPGLREIFYSSNINGLA